MDYQLHTENRRIIDDQLSNFKNSQEIRIAVADAMQSNTDNIQKMSQMLESIVLIPKKHRK